MRYYTHTAAALALKVPENATSCTLSAGQQRLLAALLEKFEQQRAGVAVIPRKRSG